MYLANPGRTKQLRPGSQIISSADLFSGKEETMERLGIKSLPPRNSPQEIIRGHIGKPAVFSPVLRSVIEKNSKKIFLRKLLASGNYKNIVIIKAIII
jgi:hypothetical protein